MADYLKKFATQADYDAYIQAGYPKPNVSYIVDNDEIIFTNYQDEPAGPDNIVTSVDVADWPSGQTAWNIGKAITEVKIPEGVTDIGYTGGSSIFSPFSFQGFTALKKVTLPSTLTTVNSLNDSDGIFKGCTSLTDVNLEDTSVTSIGKAMFYGCTSLTEIAIPSTVTVIKDYAFRGCTALASIVIPSSVTGTLGSEAFLSCTSLSSVDIPSGINLIGASCFQLCTALTSLTVRATTPPTVGYSAFNNMNQNVVIYVPAESVDAYKAASGWSTYASRIQAIPA